jgi:hypothetical protein
VKALLYPRSLIVERALRFGKLENFDIYPSGKINMWMKMSMKHW